MKIICIAGNAEVSDAHYGVTHHGWKLIKENISYDDVIKARDNLNIKIVSI